MFIVLAKIAVWELTEPFSVTKASTFDLSNLIVWLGNKSFANIIAGFSKRGLSSVLIIDWIILSVISLTSLARSFIYSSSIERNIFEKLSPVTATAYSAFIDSVLIMFSIDSK